MFNMMTAFWFALNLFFGLVGVLGGGATFKSVGSCLNLLMAGMLLGVLIEEVMDYSVKREAKRIKSILDDIAKLNVKR